MCMVAIIQYYPSQPILSPKISPATPPLRLRLLLPSEVPKVLSFLFSSNYHLFFLSSLLRVISALNSAAQPLIVDLIRSSN